MATTPSASSTAAKQTAASIRRERSLRVANRTRRFQKFVGGLWGVGILSAIVIILILSFMFAGLVHFGARIREENRLDTLTAAPAAVSAPAVTFASGLPDPVITAIGRRLDNDDRNIQNLTSTVNKVVDTITLVAQKSDRTEKNVEQFASDVNTRLNRITREVDTDDKKIDNLTALVQQDQSTRIGYTDTPVSMAPPVSQVMPQQSQYQQLQYQDGWIAQSSSYDYNSCYQQCQPWFACGSVQIAFVNGRYCGYFRASSGRSFQGGGSGGSGSRFTNGGGGGQFGRPHQTIINNGNQIIVQPGIQNPPQVTVPHIGSVGNSGGGRGHR